MRILKKTLQSVVNGLGYEIRKQSSSELNPFKMLSRLVICDSPIIFDIGAHVGSVTNSFRRLFPNSQIHAFEPFPDSFSQLNNSIKGHVGSYCHQIALADNVGTMMLNVNKDSSTNSLLETDKRGVSYWGSGLLEQTGQIEVKTSSLDVFCAENSISHIDILKMDTQGAEYSVLTGAKEMLEQQRVDIIYAELIMCPTYAGQRKLHEYLSLLDSLGYEALDFYDQIRRRRQLVQADVIFLSAASRDRLTESRV